MVEPLKVLILGGNVFLGRSIASEALLRGHRVLCAARTEPGVPDGARFLAIDRDDEVGLAPLATEDWDVVVDVAREPARVRRALRDLRAGHWVFISSRDVYADPNTYETSETAPVHEPDADVADLAYGPAKVACERLVQSTGRAATILRCGLIGGPGDVSGRSGYWPWRFSRPTGTDVLVPDAVDQPCALVDVRDLAGWAVIAAEQRLTGTYNIGGPTTTFGKAVESARTAAGSTANICLVHPDQLEEAGVQAWMGQNSLPLWIDDPALRNYATLDSGAARRAGLSTRSMEETFRDALAFEVGRGGPRGAGLSDDEERALRRRLVSNATGRTDKASGRLGSTGAAPS